LWYIWGWSFCTLVDTAFAMIAAASARRSRADDVVVARTQSRSLFSNDWS
jgi:hypothetical protein